MSQQLTEGQILTAPLFNEPMRVETVASSGSDGWVLGLVGVQSEKFRKVTLTARDLESPGRFPWHEVKKVDHYYLSVDALTQPMQVGDPFASYKNRGY
jgi:hypothetical protein